MAQEVPDGEMGNDGVDRMREMDGVWGLNLGEEGAVKTMHIYRFT